MCHVAAKARMLVLYGWSIAGKFYRGGRPVAAVPQVLADLRTRPRVAALTSETLFKTREPFGRRLRIAGPHQRCSAYVAWTERQ